MATMPLLETWAEVRVDGERVRTINHAQYIVRRVRRDMARKFLKRERGVKQ